LLYFDDVDERSARTSGEFELTETDVVDFARAWDPQPFHANPRRPVLELVRPVAARLTSVIVLARKHAS
jgi:hypothetical protein